MKSEKYKGIKVLFVNSDSFIGSKGYKLYKYSFESQEHEPYGVLKDKYAKFTRCRLFARLVRAEITNFYTLKRGAEIVFSKKAIWRRERVKEGLSESGIQGLSEGEFVRCFDVPRGSKPLNICKTPSGHLFFGEYFQNMNKDAVHVYGSMDNGETWKVVYTFEASNINHVHGLFWDEYTERMWVLTGDRENECIIGYTDDEFKTLHEVLRGGQECRSCQLFFYKDFIVYATDSQYIQNEIRKIDRKSLKIIPLVQIQGSAIKGGQSGDVSFLSTTVEPSKVNTEKRSHLWYTKDGMHWVDAISYEKDCWPAIFQFGTIEFPRYETLIKDRLYYSGRALKGLDGKSSYIEI